jgi:hypothetical protein
LTDEWVVLQIVATESEADLICGLLETAGIESEHRQSNFGAGAADGMPTGGPREVLVSEADLPAARELLAQSQDPDSPAP